eukprot:CAMPEP_0183362264 /NCGR_PEP_ID=MMETSP0164_2-20130417/68137_1 /TAXON_ID=221442 /ORGANISM="Coccolithus pelagicus ssp braarudi, Strain PLY182g" /LENGTH=62 /DNA_ID=CAMNT_0025537083 /DNA_START=154 /DNA_END=338 /DNA_ORIENTATION=+
MVVVALLLRLLLVVLRVVAVVTTAATAAATTLPDVLAHEMARLVGEHPVIRWQQTALSLAHA